MPKPNNNMFIRTGLNEMISDIEEKLKKSSASNALGYSGIEQLLTNLKNLMKTDKKIFGDDGTKEPSQKEREDYSELCSNCIAGLETIKSYSSNEEIKNSSIREISTYISDNFADKITLDLKPFIKVKQPSHDHKFTSKEKEQIQQILDNSRKSIEPKLKEHIENKIQKKKVKQARWVDFPNYGSRYGYNTENIPREIQLTGDINDLVAYYLRNNRLHKDGKDYLEKRIGTLLYFNELEKKNKDKAPEPVFKVTKESDETKFGLEGYEGKYQFQTTFNGCWSCAYAMLLESRGISLNQNIIRSFRPDIGMDEMKKLSDKPVHGLIRDIDFSPYELADLTTKVLPSTSLRQVLLKSSDPKDLTDLKAQFIDTLKEAILVQKSPVALNKNKHFVTIVGIDGDNLKVLNSRSDNKDLVDTIKIDEVMKAQPLSLTWLHDLKFTKEGKCANMPKEFENVRYSDGKLINLSTVVDPLNKNGNSFNKTTDKGKVSIHNSIYVPDSVPEAIYKLEAKKPEKKKSEKADEKIDAYSGALKAAENRCALVEKYLKKTSNLQSGNERNRIAAYITHRNIINEIKRTDKTLPEALMNEKMQRIMSKTNFDRQYNKVINSVAFRNVFKDIITKKTDASKLDDVYKSYEEKNKEFMASAAKSKTRVLIDSEISEHHNNIKKIVENWDNIKNPIDELRLTVATMLAKKTLLDSFDHTNDPDKEENFDLIRKDPNIITDISESASFKDFYLNIKAEEILKLCECKPEDRDEVVDDFYHKFVASLSKPHAAKEEKSEKKPTEKQIENPEPKKSLT